jgi:hypothetical protein
MKFTAKPSLTALFLICFVLSIYRISHVRENEISWDVLGYYLYLPATFVHQDPLLKDINWLKKTNDEKKLAGTLYMISQNEKGETMYFFLMGMAILYLPFFFAGSLFANILGFPVDGFSPPYQYSIAIGCLFYSLVGLFFLRKILLQYFTEKIVIALLFIIVFGTNAIQYFTIDNTGTANILFMLNALVVWFTLKWHQEQKSYHLILIGCFAIFSVLVKPSEVFIFLIPLIWNVYSFKSLQEKLFLLYNNKLTIAITAAFCLLIISPQLLYWHHMTGHYIYDSYKNPGVGLDIYSPHIYEVLFSYRKGWLVYTPIMLFALIGFYHVYVYNKNIFFATLTYFFISFFVIASWSEWWYGAAFSIRPLVATYPILAISFGFFIKFLFEKNIIFRNAVLSIIVLLVCFNQFQWWQYKNYIIDPYRTTKEYYWATFLKTTVTENDKKLLLIFRDFTGKLEFNEIEKYTVSTIFNEDFQKETSKGNQQVGANKFYRLKLEEEFLPIFESAYQDLTVNDHFWLKVSFDVSFPANFEGSYPCYVNTFDRKEGAYGYLAKDIVADSSSKDKWKKIEILYLTPEIRNVKDVFKSYLWKRGPSQFDIDNIKIELYRKKTNQ